LKIAAGTAALQQDQDDEGGRKREVCHEED